MPNGRTALVSDLGDLFTVRIDPTWRYRNLWNSPLGQKLSVQFMDLEDGITESASVAYVDTDIIGRGETLKTYLGTGSREVTLKFRFHAQGLMGLDDNQRVGGTNLSAIADPLRYTSDNIQARDTTSGLYAQLDREVMQPAKFLDALKFPLQTDGFVSVGPPRLLLTIGRLLSMRCKVVASQLDWKSPFDPDTMAPYAADVSVTFASTVDRVTEYNFDGPNRWTGITDANVLGGVDGPANPYSDLGGGTSGTDNARSAQA